MARTPFKKTPQRASSDEIPKETLPLDVSLLSVFAAVASRGSVTGGAEKLRITQSTASRHIAALEKKLGVLFERRSYGMELTEKGRIVLEVCSAPLETLEHGVLEALAEPDAAGILPLGAAEVFASTLAVPVHARLAAKRPRLAPYMLVAPTSTLVEQVRDGGLEFALVMHVKQSSGLGVRPLAELPHRVVVLKSLSRNRSVLARFIGSRDVEEPGIRRFPALDHLRKKVPNAHIAQSTNSLSAHKAMVLAGLGVAILPELMVRAELDAGILVPVLRAERKYPLMCVSRTTTVQSSHAKAYLSEVEDFLREVT